MITFDGRAVLDHYGAQHRREMVGKDGTTEIVHSCLIDRVHPHHSNGDRNPSASLNLDKGQYCCYSLGYGCDIQTLVTKLEQGAPGLDLLSQFAVGGTKDGESFRVEVERLLEGDTRPVGASLPTFFPSIVVPWWQTAHGYWSSRGIGEVAIDKLRLGYDEDEDRVVFPHFFKGELVGWQKRAVHGLQVPKYKSSWDFPKSETLYNYDLAVFYPRACVVESPMSVAKAVGHGIDNVVATFGASISPIQIELLGDFEMVYVWLDDDEAGRNGERKLVEGLYRKTTVMVVTPQRGMDMADATLEELVEHIENAVPAPLRLAEYGLEQKWAKHGHQFAL